jgi:hypothetical protein
VALQVSLTGQLIEDAPSLRIGDIIPAHGKIMRIETLTVQDFILYALSGGIPLYGYDEVLIDERFITSTFSKEDGEVVAESVEEGGAEDADIDIDRVEESNQEGVETDGLPSLIGGTVIIYWINKS